MDRAEYLIPGVSRISDADLLEAGIGMYHFMARTAGLITDYSSIWTDYLPLDRPIGIYCPDLDDYASGRGFSRNFLEYLPGPLLRDEEALFAFVRDVANGSAGPDARNAVIERLGAVTELGATERLMREVERRLGC